MVPVTITCTNHHVYDWSIDADVQEATIVGVGGITYPGGTGIHVKGTNTIKAFATNFGLHYINIVVILGEGNDNGGDNGGDNAAGDNGGDNGGHNGGNNAAITAAERRRQQLAAATTAGSMHDCP